MTYAIVIILSIIFTFLGFAIEITNGNIGHVKNGREPNAGAAIFPNIPFIPLVVMLFAWLLNSCYPNLVFWIVVGLFTLYLPYWWWSLRSLNCRPAGVGNGATPELPGKTETLFGGSCR